MTVQLQIKAAMLEAGITSPEKSELFSKPDLLVVASESSFLS